MEKHKIRFKQKTYYLLNIINLFRTIKLSYICMYDVSKEFI